MDEQNHAELLRDINKRLLKGLLVTLFAIVGLVFYYLLHYSPTYVPLFEEVVLTDSILLNKSFHPTKYGKYTVQLLIHASKGNVPNSFMQLGGPDNRQPVDSVGHFIHEFSLQCSLYWKNKSTDTSTIIQLSHLTLFEPADSTLLRTYALEAEPIPLRRGVDYVLTATTLKIPTELIGKPAALRMRLDGSGPMGRNWATHLGLALLILTVIVCCLSLHLNYRVRQQLKMAMRQKARFLT